MPNDVNGSRFVTLDGLRGVAALSVVFYHYGQLTKQYILPRAYSSVDFFFILSGFVLAWSYEPRLQAGMKWIFFLRDRLIRLMPIIVITSAIAGLLSWLFDLPLRSNLTIPPLLLMSFLLVPATMGRPTDLLFPLNAPQWSLCDELIVNLLWATAATRLRSGVLLAILLASATGYIATSFSFPGLHVGFGSGQMVGGLLRTATAFGLGTLLARLHRRNTRGRTGAAWPAVLLCGFLTVILSMPKAGQLDKLSSALCLFVIFPWIVHVAARVNPVGPVRRLLDHAGQLSYPVYLIHYPVLAAATVLPRLSGPGHVTTHLFSLLVIATVIGLAEILLWLDVALRIRLRRLFDQRRRPAAQTAP